MNRRTFLKDAALLVASLGLSPLLKPQVAAALEELASGRAPLLWLQGLACSGCSISLFDAEEPDASDLVMRYLSLYFHPTLSAATGESATATIEKTIAQGDYILVVEGAIPMGMPDACRIGDEPFILLLQRAARQAKNVLAVGTCAAYGGVPAAPPNLTGAVTAAEALETAGIKTPLINLPGCPTHPGWLLGTLVHLMKGVTPPLDEKRQPKRHYGELLHQKCPYFADYQEKRFALNFGEGGCQFKLGCQGVVTHSDCSRRKWNGGTSWCIQARGVCIGCTHEKFARNPDFPLYRFLEEKPEEVKG